MRWNRLILTLSAAAILIIANASRISAQTAREVRYSPAISNQPMDEAVKVEATLNRFDSALALRDIDLLQAAGINPVTAKRWHHFFKDNPRAEVTDSCPASQLFISGDSAVWNCTETATVIADGKPLPFSLGIRFTFTKSNGEWMISDRR
jgi:hypothetical protein